MNKGALTHKIGKEMLEIIIFFQAQDNLACRHFNLFSLVDII